MPTYDGITFRIRIDSKDVPEYLVETNQAKKEVICWVASESGKEFSIIVDAERRLKRWSALVFADGRKVSGHAFMDGPVVGQNIGYFHETSSTCRSLVFSDIELVADGDDALQEVLHGTSRVNRIGDILIRCRYFEVVRNVSDRDVVKSPELWESTRKIHEKTKKCISQRVGLGKVKKAVSTTTYVAKFKERIATFVFKYRPLNYLQAQKIAPQFPKSVSHSFPGCTCGNRRKLEIEPGANIKIETPDSDDEELQRLLAKAEEVRARKRRRLEEAGRPRKKFKQEEARNFLVDEVIDLT